MATYDYRSIYAPYIAQYLDHKRSIGYKMDKTIPYHLYRFDKLALERNEKEIGISRGH